MFSAPYNPDVIEKKWQKMGGAFEASSVFQTKVLLPD